MSEYSWLALYSVLILLFSMFGGSIPFLGKVTHSRLQFYLTASAGVMLGAAFFHVMPDAVKYSKEYFGWWMALGVVGLFCIERFVAPHSHEMDGNGNHHHHEHHEEFQELGVPIDEAALSRAKEHRAAAPSIAGWMAVFGLTIHTFMNGVGLAGSVQADMDKAGGPLSSAALAIPGLALFFAIFLHKPADALAISTVLSRKGTKRSKIYLVQLGFALMVPVGAAAFLITSGAIEKSLQHQLIGAALAFSAGTFLFIALSDLLPEVHFHRHDRLPLFATLLAGILFMAFISFLEPHDELEEDHAAAAAHAVAIHADHGHNVDEHSAPEGR
jgi:zinc and cadmium transporter